MISSSVCPHQFVTTLLVPKYKSFFATFSRIEGVVTFFLQSSIPQGSNVFKLLFRLLFIAVEQRFSTGMLWEFLKHALLDYLICFTNLSSGSQPPGPSNTVPHIVTQP